MNPALPPTLGAALETALEGVQRKALAAAAQKMSAGYRQGQTSRAIVSPQDASAYAVARMPATYAACAAVFARLQGAMPEFTPATVLDVGAGTGAASWAAVTAWPQIASLTMLDHNPALRTLARRLAEAGPPALAGAEILGGELGSVDTKGHRINHWLDVTMTSGTTLIVMAATAVQSAMSPVTVDRHTTVEPRGYLLSSINERMGWMVYWRLDVDIH